MDVATVMFKKYKRRKEALPHLNKRAEFVVLILMVDLVTSNLHPVQKKSATETSSACCWFET